MRRGFAKILAVIAIVLIIASVVFISYSLLRKNSSSASLFYGYRSFSFCGEELKDFRGCQKFCDYFTGVHCLAPAESKLNNNSQSIKGKCRFIEPQTGESDPPCAYCTIVCERP